jgi:hypothetical protein
MSNNRVAIIDADCLIYRSFAPRWNDITNPFGEAIVQLNEYGNKTDIKEYTKEEDAQYLKDTYNRLKRTVIEMQEKFFCNDALVAVQGDGNFRFKIFPEYKAKRANYRPNEVTKFVPILRKLLIHEGFAIPSFRCEADDLIRIWAEECKAVEQDFVIVTTDKDLQCISGKHYLIHKEQLVHVSEADAKYMYYYQLLVGDQVDNIPGLPKVGPKKAEKILEGCTTDEEFQEAVVSAYIDKLGDLWREYLLANGKLIHLKRHVDDYFSFDEWPITQVIP